MGYAIENSVLQQQAHEFIAHAVSTVLAPVQEDPKISQHAQIIFLYSRQVTLVDSKKAGSICPVKVLQ